MDKPELLTLEEVAALLRLTPKAVYHRIERGTIPGVVRIGPGTIRVRAADLRAHLGLLSSDPLVKAAG